MGKVLAVFRVLPSSDDVDLEELVSRIKSSLPEGVKVRGYEVKPIAFGLNALRMLISLPEDMPGGTENVEIAISEVEGVEQVDVEFISLEH